MKLTNKIMGQEKKWNLWLCLVFCFSARSAAFAVNWISRFY